MIRRHGGVIMDFPWNKAEGKLPSWRDHFAEKMAGGAGSAS
jgi:hypothetical protein